MSDLQPSPSAPALEPHTAATYRALLVATSLLFLMLFPHSGALGLGSAPLFLLCVWAFFRLAGTLSPVVAPRRAAPDPKAPEATAKLLRGLALTLAAFQLVRAPGEALLPATSPLVHRLLALLLCATALWATRRGEKPARHSRALAGLALASTFAAFAYLLVHAPSPRIDVFVLQQRGAELLWAGENPYSALYPNPYDPVETTAFFGHYSASLSHYPYPPLSLLVTTLSHRLTGDVRWVFLLFHLVVAWVLYGLGRGHAQTRSGGCDLGLSLLCLHLLQPRGFLVIEQAWTEPLLAGAIALWVLYRAHKKLDPGPANQPQKSVSVVADSLLLGLVLAGKQYGVWLLSPYVSATLFAQLSPPWLRPYRLRSLSLCLLPLGLSYIGFALWQPSDFLDDVVLFQLKQPFRSEALSLPAVFYALSDVRLPGATAAIGLLLPLWFVGRGQTPRLPAGLGGLLLLASLQLFGFFASAKQAFCNYYYLLGVLLLLSLTQLEDGTREAA